MSEVLLMALKGGKFYNYPQVVCLECGFRQEITIKKGQKPDNYGYIKAKIVEDHSEECKYEEKKTA